MVIGLIGLRETADRYPGRNSVRDEGVDGGR